MNKMVKTVVCVLVAMLFVLPVNVNKAGGSDVTTWREAESWDRSEDITASSSWQILTASQTASDGYYTATYNNLGSGDYAEWDFTVFNSGTYDFYVRAYVKGGTSSNVKLLWNNQLIGYEDFTDPGWPNNNEWYWKYFGDFYLSEGTGTLRIQDETSLGDVVIDNILITNSNFDPRTYGTDYKGEEGSTSHEIGQSTNNPPNNPSNPSPYDGQTNVGTDAILSWQGGDPDGDTVYYDVYLEAWDSTPDILVSDHQTSTTYDPPGLLSCDTHYYWKIVAIDEHGATTNGPVWGFWTESPAVPSVLSDHVGMVGPVSVTVYGKLVDDGNEPCACYLTVIGVETYYCESFVSGDVFSHTFGGLEPATTYEWYASAENSAGTAYGVTKTFTTGPPPVQAPNVCCLNVTNIGETWAILEAQLTNDGGEPCSCRFYIMQGMSLVADWTEQGTYNSPHIFSYNFSGLQPGTTYTGHAKVWNSNGGKDITKSFTTEQVVEPYVEYDGHVVDDDYEGDSFGSDNSLVEGGETIELNVSLVNNGLSIAGDVTADLSLDTPDSLITMINNSVDVGDIPAGETRNAVFLFRVDIEHTDGSIDFTLDIEDTSGGSWSYPVTIDVFECPGLNYQYVKQKTRWLSDVIFTVYGNDSLAKGRAFGSPGEKESAYQIKQWMTDLGYFDSVTRVPLDGKEAWKLEVVGRGLQVNIGGSGYEDVDCYISPAWLRPRQDPLGFEWHPTMNYNFWDVDLNVKPRLLNDETEVLSNEFINAIGDDLVAEIENGNLTDEDEFWTYLLGEFNKYFEFSLENFDENIPDSWPTFYETSPVPQGPDYVYIDEDPWNNPDASFPLSDFLVDAGLSPLSDYVIRAKYVKIAIDMWIMRILLPNCRGLIRYDFNDHTYDMINAKWVPLPIIFINGTVGNNIMDNLEPLGASTVRFFVNQQWNENVESYNVIGEKIGEDPNRIVIVSSLYDSWWNQGTADSAIGMGVLMGVADYFKRNNIVPSCTIRFIAFAAEEAGFLGAWDYVNNLLSEEAEKIYQMIDLNQIGFVEPMGERLLFNVITNRDCMKRDVALVTGRTDYVSRTGNLADYDTPVVRYGGGPSNNFPFETTFSTNTVLFLKDTGWTMHHRDGAVHGDRNNPHTEGDVFKYYHPLDVHVCGEMILNTTLHYTTGNLPTLSVGSTEYDFGMVVAGTYEDSPPITIENSGGGILYYDVEESSIWLTVSPPHGDCSGGGQDTIIITADIPLLMPAGDYTAIITVFSTGGREDISVSVQVPPRYLEIYSDDPIYVDDEDGWVEMFVNIHGDWGTSPYTYNFSFGDGLFYESEPAEQTFELYHKYDQLSMGTTTYTLEVTVRDNDDEEHSETIYIDVIRIQDDWNQLDAANNYAPHGVSDFNQLINESWQSPEPWGWNYCGQVAAANALWWLDSMREPPLLDDNEYADGKSHCRIVEDYCGIDDHAKENVDPFISNFADQMEYSDYTPIPADMEAGLNNWFAETLDGTGVTSSVFKRGPFNPLTFEEIEGHINEGAVVLLYLRPEYIIPGYLWLHWVTVCGTQRIGDDDFLLISDPYRDVNQHSMSLLDPNIDTVLATDYPQYAPVRNDASLVSHDIWPMVIDGNRAVLSDYWTQFWDTFIEGSIVIQVDGMVPYADFTYTPSTPITYSDILFTDNSFDPDNGILSWYWDFDDGTISTEQNPSHQYGSTGDYLVSLTVTDNDGLSNTTCQIVTVTTSPPPTPTPVLSYNPTSHDFGDMIVGATDSTTFSIWNNGSGTLNYTISESCNWVNVSPTSGSSTGEPDTITVDIDTTGLSTGSHQCDISISSNGGSGVLTVYVNIVENPTPVLSYNPTSNDFGDMQEGETSSTTFDIWNSGSGTLTYSFSESCSWVTVSPMNGDSTGEHDMITIDVDTTGLSVGSYNCDIQISSNGGNGVFTVDVNIIDGETEQIDQEQTIYNTDFSLVNKYCAQLFIPTVSPLTKIELYIGKNGNPSSDITVSIRSLLAGANLASVSKTASEISSSMSWVEFDIPDLDVTTGNTYYIVVEASGTLSDCCKVGYSGNGNLYTDGTMYQYNFDFIPPDPLNDGSGEEGVPGEPVTPKWLPMFNCDLCFKTYGMLTNPVPILSYTPTQHDFGTLAQGDSDSTSFEIWNSGTGTLSYSLSESCEWVTVSPLNGDSTGEHDTITVDIDTSTISEGSHSCDISIDGGAGGSGIFTVSVNIVLPAPVLSYTPTSHDFGDMLTDQTDTTSFEIWNSGTGTLTYSLSESYTWIEISPISGTSTGEHDIVTVDIDTTGLTEGTYTADISIMSDGGNGVFTVTVNIVTSAPVLSYTPTQYDFGTMTQGDSASTSFEIWNSGTGTLEYILSENDNWMTVTPTSGSSTGEHDTINVNIDTSSLTEGTYTGDITINSNGGTGIFTVSVQVILVSEQVDQEQTIYNTDFSLVNKYCAQLFIPTVSPLTKIELYIGKTGNPSSDITVSIRSLLAGANLASVSKTASEISSSMSWVEFDIPDLDVTTGNTYYIVVESDGTLSDCCKVGYSGSGNLYTDGTMYQYNFDFIPPDPLNGGSGEEGVPGEPVTPRWLPMFNCDLCFKTYGIG